MIKLKALVQRVKTKLVLFPRVYGRFITKMFIEEESRLKKGKKQRMFVYSHELLYLMNPEGYKYKTVQDFLFFNGSIGLISNFSSDMYIYFTKKYFPIGYIRCLIFNIGARVRRRLKCMGFIDTSEGMLIEWRDWRCDFWNSNYFKLWFSHVMSGWPTEVGKWLS